MAKAISEKYHCVALRECKHTWTYKLIPLNVIKSYIIYNVYFQSEMQPVEENIQENNNVPAHHPSSLNIYTFNKAKFHIQAQQGAMCLNIRLSAVSGWAGVACSLYSLGLIAKRRM